MSFGLAVGLFVWLIICIPLGFMIYRGFMAWHEADQEVFRRWDEIHARQEADIEEGCRKLGITRAELDARVEARRNASA